MQYINKFLDEAAKAYYQGNPIISDEEFDRLADIHKYTSVGEKVSDAIPHMHRMYSLSKVYEDEGADLTEWKNAYKTAKLDGAAMSAQYIGAKDHSFLALCLTRGDGKKGKVTFGHGLPEIITHPALAGKDFQINLEAVAPKSIKNARNYAAGALGLKSLEEFKERAVKFFAHSITPYVMPTYEEDLDLLSEAGFETLHKIDVSLYPTDGYVLRINSNEEFERLGYTNRHPRGAIAVKKQKEAVVTKLLDVKWDVGRTGVVTPVAYLEPVDIEGAMVSKATLHNHAHIQALGLKLGDYVEVIRSGEIIPKIIGKYVQG